jgi:phosphoribosyl-dephospho-CoA transferase
MTPIAQRTHRVHDLLLLRSGIASLTGAAKPAWATLQNPGDVWVVVRRAFAPEGLVAVGMRGVNRGQRWGGFANSADVKERLRPTQLSSHMADCTRSAVPALTALSWLEERMDRSELDWGPVGSVGFELATRQQVVTETSDLDIALFAPTRFSKNAACELWRVMRTASVKIDVRVETPCCGFSLEEYAREETEKVLVRLPESPQIAADPWKIPAIQDKE